jgi:hypothetical protein
MTEIHQPRSRTQAEAEAETCFHRAIEIARRQGAKSLELRAVTSLARLWEQQGKKEEARKYVGRDLRLVHRGLRHCRSEGG